MKICKTINLIFSLFPISVSAHNSLLTYGISYGKSFNQIWHYIFDRSNRQLTKNGIFIDPYGEDRKTYFTRMIKVLLLQKANLSFENSKWKIN